MTMTPLADAAMCHLTAGCHVFKCMTVTPLVVTACCMGQAWGYPNIQAYYDDINGLKWIPKIRTPTLFLSAEDDPFLGYKP